MQRDMHTPIGYVNGKPVLPIAGGSETAPETITVQDPAPAPAPSLPPANDPDKVFTREDIERARQQEKDKVYSRVDSLQERLRVFEQEREERIAAEEQARAEAAEAERKRLEAEQDTRTLLEQKEAEWKAQLQAEREERERALAILEQERAHAALEAYRNSKVREHEDEILPELLDYVAGSTPAEIDASIAGLVERSRSILENTSQALQSQRREQPGTRVTAPPVGPLENESGQKTFTAEQISAMSASEYAKYRSQFGVTGGRSNRGLFG